jgi:hypothetical protein
MKRKLNLVGNTFTHLTNGNKGYSVHGKESKYIEWVTDGGDATFYIDNTINDGIADGRTGSKYLWLLESKHIKQGLVESIIDNQQLVEDTYDIIFTHDQRLLALGEKYKWVPAQGFWIKEPKIYEKSKMISMISSNKRMCTVVDLLRLMTKRKVSVIICSLLRLRMVSTKHILLKKS